MQETQLVIAAEVQVSHGYVQREQTPSPDSG